MGTLNDPHDIDQLLDELWLHLVPGIGPRMHQVLLDRFATAGDVLAATVTQLQEVPGIGQKMASAIVNAKSTVDAEQELCRCRELGIDLLLRDSPNYPRLLNEICDAQVCSIVKAHFVRKTKSPSPSSDPAVVQSTESSRPSD